MSLTKQPHVQARAALVFGDANNQFTLVGPIEKFEECG
jgi:hypothetical protein